LKKFIGSLFLLTLALFPSRSDASTLCSLATTCSFTLNSPGTIGSPGPFGLITLDLMGNYQNSGNTAIKFTINLNDTPAPVFLVNTGNDGNHAPFGFNYSGAGTVTLGSFSNTNFSQAGSAQDQSPFGTFNTAVTFNCQGGGSCGATSSNLLTFVAQTTSAGGFTNLGDVINLSGPTAAYFTADIFYNGATGVVGVTGGPNDTGNSPVPEPQSAAMLGAGLLALGFAARKFRK